jgi:Uma2 family endonuclease
MSPAKARTKSLMTVEEFLQLPDDGGRYELLDGELIAVPTAGQIHGWIAAAIIGYLFMFVRRHDLGSVHSAQTGFRLSENPPVLLDPDVAFVRGDRISEHREGPYEFAPDLAVEVISPSNRGPLMQRRVSTFLQHGTQQVWLADPVHRTVTIHTSGSVTTLHEGDEIDGGDLLPGFRLPVSDIFPKR